MELVTTFILGVGLLFMLAEPETLEEQAERLEKEQTRKQRRERA